MLLAALSDVSLFLSLIGSSINGDLPPRNAVALRYTQTNHVFNLSSVFFYSAGKRDSNEGSLWV